VRELRVGDLVLAPLRAGDAAAMYGVLRDPALYRHLDYPPPPSVEHLQALYERLEQRKSPDGTEDWLNWTVRVGDGAIVGFVQATVQPNRAAWIAYVIGTAYQRQGIATRAMHCLLDHLAVEYGAKRFLATTEAGNAASIGVLHRLGFHDAPPEMARRHELTATERLFFRGA